MPRAVILTALQIEYVAVYQHLRDVKEEVYKGTVYERGYFDHWSVGIAEIGSGNAIAATQAERAIEHFKPDVILFVGVAGGIKNVDLGDVVVSRKVYNSETECLLPNYWLEQRAMAEAKKKDWLRRLVRVQKNSNFNTGTFNRFRELITLITHWYHPYDTPETEYKVLVAPISTESFTQGGNHKDAVAVDSAGVGLLTAARENTRVEAIVVRGISHLIGEQAAPNAPTSELLAANNASAFAFELLAKYKPKPLTTSQRFLTFSMVLSLSILTIYILYKPIKTTGALQSWDLALFDKAMQLRRSNHGQDEEIVVVEINQEGVNKNTDDCKNLPDKDLLDLLKNVLSDKPKSVLLSIYRGAVTSCGQETERKKIIDLINKHKNVVTVFGSGNEGKNKIYQHLKGISNYDQIKIFDFLPDKENESDQGVYRRGVTEFDSGDYMHEATLKNYPAYRKEEKFSFYENAPYYVARQFLGKNPEDIKNLTITQSKINGKIEGYGGYQKNDDMTCLEGIVCTYLERMTLINFRAGDKPFYTVKYNENISPGMIAGKIVIIGYSQDVNIVGVKLNTSIGNMSRAMLAAHMISEIKEHYRSSRPLIKAAPDGLENSHLFVLAPLIFLSYWLIEKIFAKDSISIIDVIITFFVVAISLSMTFAIMIFSLTQGIWISSIISISIVYAVVWNGTPFVYHIVCDSIKKLRNQ